MRLANKRALVTGAGAGIGQAIALRFAREGARVVVNDIDADSGARAVAAITAAGGEAHFVGADVRHEAEVQNLVARSVAALGGLDILVNNAGIELIKPLTAITEEEWDRLMGINVKGVFFGCKHGIPAIEKSGGGAVINMASVAGIIGWPLLSCYCASKGAVIQLTRALAQEYKGRGLRFNALCPTLAQSDLGERFIDGYESYGVQVMQALGPRQVRLVTADEVASAALFLADDESGFVNGHALVIDNGVVSG